MKSTPLVVFLIGLAVPAMGAPAPEEPRAGYTQETGALELAPMPETAAETLPAERVTEKPSVRWASPTAHAVLFRPGAVTLRWNSTFPAGTVYSVTWSTDGKTFSNVAADNVVGTSARWAVPDINQHNVYVRVKAMDAQRRPLGTHVARVHVLPRNAVVISKVNQTLWAFRDGQVRHRYIVSTGAKETETRAGLHAVYNRKPHHHSSLYDAPMPFTLFFDKGQAIHASTYMQELGTAVSHGCVRMAYNDARGLFNDTQVGTPVLVTDWNEDMGCLDAVPGPAATRHARAPRPQPAKPGKTVAAVSARAMASAEPESAPARAGQR